MMIRLFDTVETALIVHMTYVYTATWLIDPTILTKIVWYVALNLIVHCSCNAIYFARSAGVRIIRP